MTGRRKTSVDSGGRCNSNMTLNGIEGNSDWRSRIVTAEHALRLKPGHQEDLQYTNSDTNCTTWTTLVPSMSY